MTNVDFDVFTPPTFEIFSSRRSSLACMFSAVADLIQTRFRAQFKSPFGRFCVGEGAFMPSSVSRRLAGTTAQLIAMNGCLPGARGAFGDEFLAGAARPG
jgi:hypothetical protein